MDTKKLTAGDVIDLERYEGIVTGVPTGMYADRDSYGNAPILALIIDGILPCKFRANPYSHRTQNAGSDAKGVDKLLGVEFLPDDENENLGVAAAYVDQSIRGETQVEVHGVYESQVFRGQYLKVGNFGFEFPGYKFVFERDEQE